MIRFIVSIALLVSLLGCSHTPVIVHPPPPINPDFAVTVTWSYDFTNFAACSATVTKGCISGFSWGYLQGASQVTLGSVAPSACTGTSQPLACKGQTNSQLPMGQLTWSAVANYVDNAGVAGSTIPGTSPTPTTISAGVPSNVSGTAQ